MVLLWNSSFGCSEKIERGKNIFFSRFTYSWNGNVTMSIEHHGNVTNLFFIRWPVYFLDFKVGFVKTSNLHKFYLWVKASIYNGFDWLIDCALCCELDRYVDIRQFNQTFRWAAESSTWHNNLDFGHFLVHFCAKPIFLFIFRKIMYIVHK